MKNNFVITMLLASASLYAANEATTSSSCPTASSSITITKDGRDLTFDPAILNQSVTYRHMIEDVQMDAANQAIWVKDVVEDLTYEQTQALLHALGLQDENALRDYLDSLSPDKLIVMVQMAGYLDVQLLYDQAVKMVAQKIRNKVINGNTLGIKQLGLYLTDIAQEYYLLIGRRISQVPQWLRNFWVIGASELNQAQRITNEDERRAFLASLDGEILIGAIQRYKELQIDGKLDDLVLYKQIIDAIAQKIMDKEITGVKAKQLEPFLNDIAKSYYFIAFKKLQYSNRMRFPSIDKFVPSWLVKHLSFSIQELIDKNVLPGVYSDSVYFEGRFSVPLQVLNLKNLYISSLEGLQNIPGIKTVQVLWLGYNQLTTLQPGIFNGLTALQELCLDGNQLSELPENIFNDLTALQKLWLSRNQLSTLPVGIFNGLTALQHLYLDYNQLSELPENIFNDLTALQGLNLSRNQLTTLPENIFNDLTALQELMLSFNQLSELPENIFNRLTALQGLLLNYNQLTTLPAGIFNGLTALQKLWLLDNRLSTLQPGVFNGLTALQELLLGFNQLSTLQPGIFNDLARLRRLSLHGNQLSTLQPGVFNGLTALQELLLSSNQLTTLPAGIFNGLTALRWLWLNGNQLSTLQPGVFNGLTALRWLWLKYNQLSDDQVRAIRAVLQGRNVDLDIRNQQPPQQIDGFALAGSSTGSEMADDSARGQKRKRGSDEESEDQDQDEELDRDGK